MIKCILIIHKDTVKVIHKSWSTACHVIMSVYKWRLEFSPGWGVGDFVAKLDLAENFTSFNSRVLILCAKHKNYINKDAKICSFVIKLHQTLAYVFEDLKNKLAMSIQMNE